MDILLFTIVVTLLSTSLAQDADVVAVNRTADIERPNVHYWVLSTLPEAFQSKEIVDYVSMYDALNVGERSMVDRYLGNVPETDTIIDLLSETSAISPFLGKSAVNVYRIWQKKLTDCRKDTRQLADNILLTIFQTIVKVRKHNKNLSFNKLKEELLNLSSPSQTEFAKRFPEIDVYLHTIA